MPIGISRYDQPAQAQFMQTYVPVPFQEILQAGLTKQKTYDTNRSSFEQAIADTQNLGYIPNSQDQAYIESLRSRLEAVRDQYLDKDYSNPEITRQLYKDINANVNRNLVNRIQQSHEGYKQYQQLAAKATSEGKSLFNPYNFTGYSTEGSGIFAGQPEPLHDWRSKEETYFNDLKPSSYTDKNTGETVLYIDDTQIDRLAKAGLQDYAQSTEGNQKLRNYLDKGGDQSKATEYLYQELYKTGQEMKMRQHQAWKPEYLMKEKDPSGYELPTAESESVAKKVKLPVDISGIKVNKEGGIEQSSLLTPFKYVGDLIGSAFSFEDPRSLPFTQKDILRRAERDHVSLSEAKNLLKKENGLPVNEVPSYSKTKNLTTDQKNRLESLRKLYPSFTKKDSKGNYEVSSGKMLKLTQEAKADLEEGTINLVEMSNLANDNLLQEVANNSRHRKILILDGDGQVEGRENVLKELKMDATTFEDYITKSGKQLGGFTQDGPEAGMFYIEIPVGKKKRRVLISSNDQIQSYTKSSFAVNQMVQNMGTGLVRPGIVDPSTRQEIAYYVEGDISEDSETRKGKYGYNVYWGYVDQENNFNPVERTTLTDIKQRERKAIQGSSYLGTGFNQVSRNQIK